MEIAESVCENQIKTCRILAFFVTSWFFNQTFKIIEGIKIFHSFIINHYNIEVTFEYNLNVNFGIFITDKIQQKFVFMGIIRAIEKHFLFRKSIST